MVIEVRMVMVVMVVVMVVMVMVMVVMVVMVLVMLKEEFCRSEAGDLFHKLEVKEISRESVSMGCFLKTGIQVVLSYYY